MKVATGANRRAEEGVHLRRVRDLERALGQRRVARHGLGPRREVVACSAPVCRPSSASTAAAPATPRPTLCASASRSAKARSACARARVSTLTPRAPTVAPRRPERADVAGAVRVRGRRLRAASLVIVRAGVAEARLRPRDRDEHLTRDAVRRRRSRDRVAERGGRRELRGIGGGVRRAGAEGGRAREPHEDLSVPHCALSNTGNDAVSRTRRWSQHPPLQRRFAAFPVHSAAPTRGRVSRRRQPQGMDFDG